MAQTRTRSKSYWTSVAKILGTTVLGLMMLIAYLEFHYAEIDPQVPDARRVYPLNVHGRIVYLDVEERELLYLCEAASLAFVLGFAANVTLSLKGKQS